MAEMKHDKFARMRYKNGESLFVNTEYITAYGFIKEQDQTVITVLGEGKEIYFPGDQTNKLLKDQQPKTGHWKRTGRKNVYGGIEIVCSVCDNHVMVQNMDDELFCRHCGAEMSETFDPVADT